MPNLNDVKLMGFTTRDIELKHTQSGIAVCDVGMAITRKFKSESGEKKEDTVFVDVTLFGRQAEIAAEYVKKGDPLFVQGRLHLDRWTDKQTNQERTRLKVVGEGIQLLTKPQKADNGTAAKGSRPAPARASTKVPPQGPPLPDDVDAESSDVPF
jgi:single-strand DNA-binding protein